jgi:phosphatidate cytidylyltransferase
MKKFFIRLISGLAFGSVAIAAMLWNKYSFFILMSIILIGSLYEYFKITSVKREASRSFFTGGWFLILLSFIVFFKSFILLSPPTVGVPDTSSLALALFQLISGLRDTGLAFMALVPMMVFILFIAELFSKSEKPFENIGWKTTAVFWIVIPVILTNKIYFDKGGVFVLAMFMLIWIYDSACYIFGSLLGKRKLFERVSPLKTVEGMVGGMIFTVAVAYFAADIPYLDMLSRLQWMILAFIISIAATLGDLIESMLKRSLGVKDSGSIMPGHGGFLDRMDAYFLTVPFVVMALWTFSRLNDLMLVLEYMNN